MRRATKLIHHPGAYCKQTGAVNPPIYQVSTFQQDAVGRNKGYDYSRTRNPTRDVLESYIASLEEGAFGFAFSSGMAAISSCLMLLQAGDHILVTEGLYGGTYRVLRRVFEKFKINCTFVDTGQLNSVAQAFNEATRAVLVETPSNPLMHISDIAAIAKLAHRNRSLLMVDNTFMSPWLQRPLTHGADVVIHSATKFLGGHSDLVAGLAVVNDPDLAERLHQIQNAVGAVPSPIDCWLLVRGMKTLGIRLMQGQRTADEIAHWLKDMSQISEVFYLGFEDFPGYAIHKKQADGPGAILSFKLNPGISAEMLVNNVSIWTLAVSLGAVESIITLPSQMTHLTYPRKELEALKLDDSLVRLSVGIEDPEDLIA
jgi:cystathionine beta-lyase/cystathionine gamma-synthase